MMKTLQVRGKFNLHTFHETIDTNHLLSIFSRDTIFLASPKRFDCTEKRATYDCEKHENWPRNCSTLRTHAMLSYMFSVHCC